MTDKTVSQELLENLYIRLSPKFGQYATDKHVASALNVSRQTVARWASGAAGMSTAIIVRAVDLLWEEEKDRPWACYYYLVRRHAETEQDERAAALTLQLASEIERLARIDANVDLQELVDYVESREFRGLR